MSSTRPFPRADRRSRSLVALAVFSLLAAPALATAADIDPVPTAGPLEEAAAKLAKELKGLLVEERQTTLAVGKFIGPAQYPSTGGPAIAHALIDQLKALKVVPNNKDYALEVNGNYLAAEREGDDEAGKVMVTLAWRVLDRKGKSLLSGRLGITNPDAVIAILGPSVALPADSTAKERNEKLIRGIVTPSVHIETAANKADAPKSIVRVAPGSPFALEVLVDGKPRAAQDRDGRAYLPFQVGETYAIRLINDSPTEAAVTLNIDGLNAFTFSALRNPDGQLRYKHWIVPAKQSMTIQGWHRTNEAADQFEVGEFANSAVARMLQSDGDVGTITATFAAAWADGVKPPDDEPVARDVAGGAATLRGSPVEQTLREVNYHVGVLRATLSIRYEKP